MQRRCSRSAGAYVESDMGATLPSTKVGYIDISADSVALMLDWVDVHIDLELHYPHMPNDHKFRVISCIDQLYFYDMIRWTF